MTKQRSNLVLLNFRSSNNTAPAENNESDIVSINDSSNIFDSTPKSTRPLNAAITATTPIFIEMDYNDTNATFSPTGGTWNNSVFSDVTSTRASAAEQFVNEAIINLRKDIDSLQTTLNVITEKLNILMSMVFAMSNIMPGNLLDHFVIQ